MAEERKETGGGATTAPEARTPGREERADARGASAPAGRESDGGGDEGLGDKAREMTESAKGAAREAKERAGAGARRVREEARRRGQELRHGAEEQAERWSDRMGSRAEHVAHALDAASESLESEGERALADMVEDAARQVERVGGYLEGEEPSSMMADLRRAGRQNPGAFLGGAVLLGLAAGRFLRASEPNGPDGGGDPVPSRSSTPGSRPGDPAAASRRAERPSAGSTTDAARALQTTPAGRLERGGESARPTRAHRTDDPTRDERGGGAS